MITLQKAIVIDGKEITEIKLDLESLTGQDIISAVAEAKALRETAPVPEFGKTYQAVIAAKASGIPVDDIIKLKARDFSLITRTVADFLFG